MSSNSYFDANVLMFFGMGVACVLFTVITFGLGGPWAICWYKTWEASHTVIDGRRLKFTGKGHQLFFNYIKWLLFTIITIGIYGFWFGLRLKQWEINHMESHY